MRPEATVSNNAQLFRMVDNIFMLISFSEADYFARFSLFPPSTFSPFIFEFHISKAANLFTGRHNTSQHA